MGDTISTSSDVITGDDAATTTTAAATTASSALAAGTCSTAGASEDSDTATMGAVVDVGVGTSSAIAPRENMRRISACSGMRL